MQLSHGLIYCNGDIRTVLRKPLELIIDRYGVFVPRRLFSKIEELRRISSIRNHCIGIRDQHINILST